MSYVSMNDLLALLGDSGSRTIGDPGSECIYIPPGGRPVTVTVTGTEETG